VRHASFLPAQLEAHLGAGEGAFEKTFCLLIAGFDAGVNLLGHGRYEGW